jgi:hypothetical protein
MTIALAAQMTGWPTPVRSEQGRIPGGQDQEWKLSTDRLDVTATQAQPD